MKMRKTISVAVVVLLMVVPLLQGIQTVEANTPISDVEILSHSSYYDGFSFDIVGELRNNGSDNLDYVEITATFYNETGGIIGNDWGWVSIDILVPNQRSPFEISFWNDTAVYDYSLAVTDAEITEKMPYRGFKIISRSSYIEYGSYHVPGTLNVTGVDIGQIQIQDVRVVGTFYDSNNTVVGEDSDLTSPNVLGYGNMGLFELVVYDQVTKIHNYSLQVVCDEYVTGERTAYEQLLEDYQNLQEEYSNLNQSYHSLLENYTTLQTNYTSLLTDFENLNDTYHSLLTNYTELEGKYENLTDEYNALNETYHNLLGRYDTLNTTYYNLVAEYKELNLTYYNYIATHSYNNSEYEALNRTYRNVLNKYTDLQADYENLNNTYHGLVADYEDLLLRKAVLTIIWDDVEHPVVVHSNSTLSNFIFNRTKREIRFNAEGEPDTLGYCNITVPNSLLWGEYTVYVDGTEVQYIETTNETHTFLYFTYEHSTKKIHIQATEAIPEFPILLILPLFMIATLLAVILYRIKPKRGKERKDI